MFDGYLMTGVRPAATYLSNGHMWEFRVIAQDRETAHDCEHGRGCRRDCGYGQWSVMVLNFAARVDAYVNEHPHHCESVDYNPLDYILAAVTSIVSIIKQNMTKASW